MKRKQRRISKATTFSVVGRLVGSHCSHGSAAITRARAARLFAAARKYGSKPERFSCGSTRVIALPFDTTQELPGGYSYGTVELWMAK